MIGTKFDMEMLDRHVNGQFYYPSAITVDEMVRATMEQKAESLKPLAKKFFEFNAPTDITWAWELEPAMIIEMDC